MTQHPKKTDDTDRIDYLSFRVSPEFKREFKAYAAIRGVSMTELLQRAFDALKRADKAAK